MNKPNVITNADSVMRSFGGHLVGISRTFACPFSVHPFSPKSVTKVTTYCLPWYYVVDNPWIQFIQFSSLWCGVYHFRVCNSPKSLKRTVAPGVHSYVHEAPRILPPKISTVASIRPANLNFLGDSVSFYMKSPIAGLPGNASPCCISSSGH